MEHLIALLPLLGSQPALQAVAGALALVLCTFMVLRANKDKQSLPPPAPATIADVPMPFLQGPREVIDIMREQRDYLRRLVEDTGPIRECVRITREENRKQTEILEQMAIDQKVEFRVTAADREHRDRER